MLCPITESKRSKSMAKKKTAGIKKVGDRQFEIDKIEIINGKRVHIRKSGFASAQEAKDALAALVEAKRREIAPQTCAFSFDKLCDLFEQGMATKSKPQTVQALHYMIGKHILPSFSGLKVQEALSFERVQYWYAEKARASEDSANRKNKVFAVFRQIVEFAYKNRYVCGETRDDLVTMVENVRLPNKAKGAKAVWTREQEAVFLSAIPQDSIDYPLFTLFCYLGCRLGEFQGLQWKCFDQKRRTIIIGQQIVRLNGGTVLSDELKTNESYRINELDENTFDLLVKYRATLNSSADDEYIFPSPLSNREPLSRTEFRRRFNKYIVLSGVPKIVPHGVRKSKATMIAGVCQNAEEVAVAAKFLGHSPSMFMGTYVSQTGVQQSDLINRLKGGDGR